ncbi:MAG: AAA family ATPase, partial [Pyrinomonadaceae bacterium]|nr:AAA family ATPase [Phycisphaerales bacterium]
QGRQLPDKAVSLIETACARVAVGQESTPCELEDAQYQVKALETELRLLARELAIGAGDLDRQKSLQLELGVRQKRVLHLTERFQQEKILVTQIVDRHRKLRAAPTGQAHSLSESERCRVLAETRDFQSRLAGLQGERPLVVATVDASIVAAVVEDWTGVPVGRMLRDEVEGVLKLADTLQQRVIGQRHVLEAIASNIQLNRTKLDNPGRPVGVFMLVGPSGVGKTETAIALAESLYGGSHAMITINMSEYQERHKVSTLMGSPPGYVGYGQGGVLTEAVRRRPYSVVLLDEIEKAHADVHEIFFQVFEKGTMKDSEGVDIDFKNTIILLTSNVGAEVITGLCSDPSLRPDAEALGKALREPLLKVFPPALLGRMSVIPYFPISDEIMRSIIHMQLSKIGQRVQEGHKVPFTYDPQVVETVALRATETESGARAVDAILVRQLLPHIAREILQRLVTSTPIRRVHVGVKESEFTYEFA